MVVYASFVSITSRQHPFVQRCRQLAAGRGEPGDVLLDGPHLVQDALDAGLALEGAVVDERGADLANELRRRGVPVHVVSPSVLDAASPVRTPSGVVAIARWTPLTPAALLDADHPILVGLVGVQDPGNVGNIIRSADALGASGVLALDGTAAPGGWKALRGAMGSTFRHPVATGTAADVLAAARARGIRIAATVAAGGAAPDAAALRAPVLVLIGSEGAGLPDAVAAAADIRLTLPMRSRVNSLNAATTAAIVLWELTRVLRAPMKDRP
jgi:TrmH family RNA methyltransferase